MPNFRDPQSGGEKLPLDELKGSLLLFSVHEQMAEMQTSFGVATPIPPPTWPCSTVPARRGVRRRTDLPASAAGQPAWRHR